MSTELTTVIIRSTVRGTYIISPICFIYMSYKNWFFFVINRYTGQEVQWYSLKRETWIKIFFKDYNLALCSMTLLPNPALYQFCRHKNINTNI